MNFFPDPGSGMNFFPDPGFGTFFGEIILHFLLYPFLNCPDIYTVLRLPYLNLHLKTINSKTTLCFIFHPSFYVDSGIRDEKMVGCGSEIRFETMVGYRIKHSGFATLVPVLTITYR
jgi:hypothetical protein